MSDLRKAAEAVLEAWDWDWSEPRNEALRERMEALRQALAQPEQEPVLWMMPDGKNVDKWGLQFYDGVIGKPLYTAPPKREWVGLTDEEAREISFNLPIKWTGHLQGAASIYDFARAIEAKLKEKNT